MKALPWLAAPRITIAAVAIATMAVPACKSDSGGTDEAIRQYCTSLLASPAYACCSDADRAAPLFVARNHYASAGDCANQLRQTLAENAGKRAFDQAAANGCLAYFSARACGTPPSSAAEIAASSAGCSRVLVGVQAAGQPCSSSDDCQVGLFCPPNKDTGSSSCAKPAAVGEACPGASPPYELVHPQCQPGLFCSLVGENPNGCPNPPCLDNRCVPFYDEGEACSGLECDANSGLSCLAGVCAKGGPSPAGGPCRLSEFCAAGLYCDPAQAGGTCQPRKPGGAPCIVTADPSLSLECRGQCQRGVCAGFCGAN
jgi:hypothetical protein